MANSYGADCSTNTGWFGIVEDTTPTCSSWESKATPPFAIYSDSAESEIYNSEFEIKKWDKEPILVPNRISYDDF